MKDPRPPASGPIDQPVFWAPSRAFLKYVIAFVLAGCAAFVIAIFVFVPDQTVRALGPASMSLVAAIAWFFLVRRRLDAVVRVLALGLWLTVTGIAFFNGGVGATIIIVYPMIILMAGWLVGMRAAVAFALLALVATLGFVVAELWGFLPAPAPTAPLMRWIVQCVVFIVSLLMIAFLVRSYRERLEEVRKLGSDLALSTAELQAREADLNRAQAVARVGSWVYDIATDVMRLSAEACRMFGLPEGTAGSRASYLARVHVEDRSAVEHAWQAALEGGGHFDHEHRVLVGDSIRWVRQKAELELDANGTPLRSVGTAQDITERVQLEQALRVQTERLLIGQRAAGMVIMDWDIVKDELSWSDSPEWLRGPLPEGGAYPLYVEQVHPEDRECFLAARAKGIDTLQPQDQEYRIVRTDGRMLWVHSHRVVLPGADGKAARMLVALQDVTERRRKDIEYRTIIQASTDGFSITDPAGHMLDVNDALCRMLGYTREELLRMNFREVTAGTSEQEIAARVREIMQTGSALYQSRRRRKDGVVLDVEVSILYVAALGERFFAFVRDVTGRKRAEAERAQLEAQLRESQKMEALGTLAGGVAHDFNNIVATIMGNVELANQDVGSGHAALESLEEIRKASIRAKNLVQQILAFGRRQVLERELIALAPVVQESARLLRSTLPAGVSLSVECAPDAPAVLADMTQVQQVLLNLCANAWQAMQGQERPAAIELGLALHLADGAPYAGPERRSGAGRIALRPGRYACLTVRDNGPGMDQATRSRIFEPFFTTKPVGKGTGLGLAVVHGIVQDHGASIVVQSVPGEGATFRIYFPESQQAADPAQAGQALKTRKENDEPLVLQAEGKSILYVDDDESIVFLMTRMLERQGYRVSGYTDAHAALAAVRAQPQAFHLIVTDYNMPGLSGLELARALREIRADLPVVLASGYITDELRLQAPVAGVMELVYKPNTANELCSVVARLAHSLPI